MTNTETMPQGIDSIPEEFRYLVECAKVIKDGRVERAQTEQDDPGDIVPHASFFRGADLVAHGFAPHVNRDEGLDLACMGVHLFGADRVELLLDAHISDQRFFERYGRLPDPHELQNLCDNEGACEIGLITDCIIACRLDKGDPPRLVFASVPYHVDKRRVEIPAKEAKATRGEDRERIFREGSTYFRIDKTCHWQDDRVWALDDTQPKQYMSGIVADALRLAFTRESVLDDPKLDPAEFGLTEQEARLHADIAGTRMLAQLGFGVALAARTDEEMAVIEESMARYGRLSLIDPDTMEVAPKSDEPANPTVVMQDVLLELARTRMERHRDERHERELAEAAANRAARAEGKPTPSDLRREAEARADAKRRMDERSPQ